MRKVYALQRPSAGLALRYIRGMDSERGSSKEAEQLFGQAVAIMARLRGPGGCPWDREQSFASIQPYTLEETYEVFDAIDRRHWPDLCEELGDLLLQVLFYAQMASEAGYFGIGEVIAGLNDKLVRRHPHVFAAAAHPAGEARAAAIDSAQVLRNWEAIKREEKANRPAAEAQQEKRSSALDGVLRSLPALAEARKLGSRAHRSGFDWPDVQGLFDKLHEETGELVEAIEEKRAGSARASEAEREAAAARPDGAWTGEAWMDNASPGSPSAEAATAAVAAEVGDLLFTTANLARHLDVDPEFALRGTNARFRRRFAAMEHLSTEPLETLPAAELELLWARAKQQERDAEAGRNGAERERRSALPLAP